MGEFLQYGQYLHLQVSKSLGVGAIRYVDQFEQVLDTYYIPEASEKFFKDDISMVRPQKMYILDALKAFISNFTYCNL